MTLQNNVAFNLQTKNEVAEQDRQQYGSLIAELKLSEPMMSDHIEVYAKQYAYDGEWYFTFILRDKELKPYRLGFCCFKLSSACERQMCKSSIIEDSEFTIESVIVNLYPNNYFIKASKMFANFILKQTRLPLIIIR